MDNNTSIYLYAVPINIIIGFYRGKSEKSDEMTRFYGRLYDYKTT